MPSSSSALSTSCVATPPHSRSRVRNVTLSRAAAGRGHGSMRRRSVTLTRSKYARPVGARARGLVPRSANGSQSVCIRQLAESPVARRNGRGWLEDENINDVLMVVDIYNRLVDFDEVLMNDFAVDRRILRSGHLTAIFDKIHPENQGSSNNSNYYQCMTSRPGCGPLRYLSLTRPSSQSIRTSSLPEEVFGVECALNHSQGQESFLAQWEAVVSKGLADTS